MFDIEAAASQGVGATTLLLLALRIEADKSGARGVEPNYKLYVAEQYRGPNPPNLGCPLSRTMLLEFTLRRTKMNVPPS
jgi:hypothetical protein